MMTPFFKVGWLIWIIELLSLILLLGFSSIAESSAVSAYSYSKLSLWSMSSAAVLTKIKALSHAQNHIFFSLRHLLPEFWRACLWNMLLAFFFAFIQSLASLAVRDLGASSLSSLAIVVLLTSQPLPTHDLRHNQESSPTGQHFTCLARRHCISKEEASGMGMSILELPELSQRLRSKQVNFDVVN